MQGLRLDQALVQLFPEHSRARFQSWISQGKVKVDGQPWQSKKDKIRLGQSIEITAPPETAVNWEAQALPLDIIYEDDSLLVVNKPAGLVVHPAAGNPDNTLVNALLHYLPTNNTLPRAGIVHRLDKDTSGLLMVARTLTAHTSLVTQLQARRVKREYLALVHGVLIAGNTVNAPIARHPRHRLQQAVVENGKPAITHYRVMQRFSAHTLVRVFLETGRTHQIRVHMAHVGYPLVGDPLYVGRGLKGSSPNFNRQALHAHKLCFQHPTDQKEMEFTAPIPEDFLQLLYAL